MLIVLLIAVSRRRTPDIFEIGVAFGCITIPAEHAVDGCREFGTARPVNTACVDPKVSQAIAFGLVAAETNLAISRFSETGSLFEVLVEDLF
jgi:hypothetical protein